MKQSLESLKSKIDELHAEMMKVQAAHVRYSELSQEKYKLSKEYTERLKSQESNRLRSKTGYEEPEYPSMGSGGSDGKATFENKEDAEKLVEILLRDYKYGYVLEWNGPGDYTVEPDWNYDHDGDVVYTATFKKL